MCMELLNDILSVFYLSWSSKIMVEDWCLSRRSALISTLGRSHSDCAKLDKMTIVGILLIYSYLSY